MAAMTEGVVESADDPYLWLEDVDGASALDWVRSRNAAAFGELAVGPRYAGLRDGVREILDADDRIPYVTRRNEYLYNFWQDADHPRGVWRRTTLESYRTVEPDWDVLLDVDALAAAESENWVWKGAGGLYPDFERYLIRLSRGGADAVVVREWDTATRGFVPDGFALPEAKAQIGWIDRDSVYVGTDFGPGSMTSSGYPRIAKRWRRGTPLSEAQVVFEGEHDDVSAYAYRDPTQGYVRHFASRSPDFFTSETYLRAADGSYSRIDVPLDADIDVDREWLLIRPRTPWTVGGVEYRSGSLLAARFDDYMAGGRSLSVLFEPGAHTSLSYWTWTRNHLILATLSDVKTRLHLLTPAADWRREPLPGAPEIGEAAVLDTDPDHGDEYFLDSQSFTEPSTLRRGAIGEEVEVLRRSPARYDAAGVETNQYFATSADGTRVPYFVVGRPGDGPVPVLMTGYGGFEVSLTPSYSGVVGHGWLASGGTYAVANIRGGGEYGPDWHQAALRERRPRAYEDFAAVARDLVARGITTAPQLGIRGGSNGGLLMGVMLTTYPELFGAIVCEVPLLDMRRYHLLLAGASWMAEWGDPDDPADWDYLRGYSPYHLIRPDRAYPPVLFVTSTRDDRVHPGHARKMMARMQEYGLDARYYENIEGGHGAAADNEQAAVKWALVLEFLWRQLTR
jgi:prolyl oligopeptidase